MEVLEGSMGRPMPGWEVSILDEDERPVPPGERGEICLKARSNPHYPLGCWNRPDEDSEEVFGGGVRRRVVPRARTPPVPMTTATCGMRDAPTT